MADTPFYTHNNCTIGGVGVSFRSRTSPEQMEQVRLWVEEQYERLKNHGGQYGREQLLTLLVLGVADELLQSQRELDEVEHRLETLLKRIEKAN